MHTLKIRLAQFTGQKEKAKMLLVVDTEISIKTRWGLGLNFI